MTYPKSTSEIKLSSFIQLDHGKVNEDGFWNSNAENGESPQKKMVPDYDHEVRALVNFKMETRPAKIWILS
jgi:hypothetical protein